MIMMTMLMIMMILRKSNLTPNPKSVSNNAVDCKPCLILCIVVYFF